MRELVGQHAPVTAYPNGFLRDCRALLHGPLGLLMSGQPADDVDGPAVVTQRRVAFQSRGGTYPNSQWSGSCGEWLAADGEMVFVKPDGNAAVFLSAMLLLMARHVPEVAAEWDSDRWDAESTSEETWAQARYLLDDLGLAWDVPAYLYPRSRVRQPVETSASWPSWRRGQISGSEADLWEGAEVFAELQLPASAGAACLDHLSAAVALLNALLSSHEGSPPSEQRWFFGETGKPDGGVVRPALDVDRLSATVDWDSSPNVFVDGVMEWPTPDSDDGWSRTRAEFGAVVSYRWGCQLWVTASLGPALLASGPALGDLITGFAGSVIDASSVGRGLCGTAAQGHGRYLAGRMLPWVGVSDEFALPEPRCKLFLDHLDVGVMREIRARGVALHGDGLREQH